jgi:hypothetical protein
MTRKDSNTIPTGMFTRFYIPFILSLLVLIGIFVILTIPPGVVNSAAATVMRRAVPTFRRSY